MPEIGYGDNAPYSFCLEYRLFMRVSSSILAVAMGETPAGERRRVAAYAIAPLGRARAMIASPTDPGTAAGRNMNKLHFFGFSFPISRVLMHYVVIRGKHGGGEREAAYRGTGIPEYREAG